MKNAAAMLYCPNSTCQAPNFEGNNFCQKCRAPLVRQYLWSVGGQASAYQPGDLLGDRYLCKQTRIFLDTKPGVLSSNSVELPARFLPYLRLSPLRLHVPQVYEWFFGGTAEEIVLLDYAPLSVSLSESEAGTEAPQVQVFPALIDRWPEASPLRQLNWLWQIANLWQPLLTEQAASSLLESAVLRVEGSLLRLLELRSDTDKAPTLADLGQLWLQWSATARPEILARLQAIAQQLIQGQIHNAELLVEQLDGAIAELASSQSYQIQIGTLTDQGPTRQRNEDACYPASGTLQQTPFAQPPLVIVCDGIGGHQGGDVASHLAIETVEQRVKNLKPEALDPVTLTVELEKAVCAANDQISQRNDTEQRFDRQRMGTTLVMGLVRDYELYVTHVGDSRAYWITRWGCHQLTLDDDVASREVRLGYSSYRQALQQPSAGSLVQALGMGTSNLLYPTVQRLILDEDSVLLLCSDGLSDNDRVETLWDTEILPLLNGEADLALVARRLVEIANTLNGYDNATVGLLYCRVTSAPSPPILADLPAEVPATRSSDTAQATAIIAPSYPPEERGSDPELEMPVSSLETKILRPPAKPNFLPLLLGIIVLAGVGAGLIAYFMPSLGQRAQSPSPLSDPTPASPSPSPAQTPSPRATLTALTVGSRLQMERSPAAASPTSPTLFSSPPQGLPLVLAEPGATPEIPQSLGVIPVGSILEVLSVGGPTQQDRWVQVRVCSTPVGESSAATPPGPAVSPQVSPGEESPVAERDIQVEPPEVSPAPSGASPAPASPTGLLQSGQAGWIREAELLPLVVASQPSEQQGACGDTALTNRIQ
jgi:protein phosphatase